VPFCHRVHRKRRTELHSESVAPVESVPIIGVIIPSLNVTGYLDSAVRSIASQTGQFGVRLHVQDGGSSDGAIEKLNKWKRMFDTSPELIGPRFLEFTFDSSPDEGLYSGLNRGFRHLQADWYTWIGADDFFLPWAFQSVMSLSKESSCDWILGSRLACREDGVPFGSASQDVSSWVSQAAISAGRFDNVDLPYIQQEGVFWSHNLWTSVGATLDETLKYAGDYELWTRFALYAEPIIVNRPLGVFRNRSGQRSENQVLYAEEVESIKSRGLANSRNTGEKNPAPTASVDARTGLWEVDVCGRESGGSRSSVSQENWDETSGVYWRLGSGWRQPEGPFPEIGVARRFIWLCGPKEVVQVSLPREGHFRLTMEFGNTIEDQVLDVTCPGVRRKMRLTPKHLTETESLSLNFYSPIPTATVYLHFKKHVSSREDPRKLSLAMFAFSIEPVEFIAS